MRKVLIHTLLYKNYNYGAMVQAYALYKTVQNIGYDCEELLYTQVVDGIISRIKYRLFRIFEILLNPVQWIKEKKQEKFHQKAYEDYLEIVGEDKIQKAFERFMEKEFRTTAIYTPKSIKKIQDVYDCYIVGGDQVWNPKWIDCNYFGRNLKDVRRIGYSCSAGANLNFNGYYRSKLRKNIERMDIISVREREFNELLRKMNVKSIVIPDPVFLFDRVEWIEFSEDMEEIPRDYIFVYLLGQDNIVRKNIVDYANRKKKKIVFIPYIYRRYSKADEGFADIEILDADPREFAGLIKNASLIITDSFHGTALSIILEKNFICINRHKQPDARLNSLIEDYNFQDQFLMSTEIEKIYELNTNIDYYNKKVITQNKREDAKKFINQIFE